MSLALRKSPANTGQMAGGNSKAVLPSDPQYQMQTDDGFLTARAGPWAGRAVTWSVSTCQLLHNLLISAVSTALPEPKTVRAVPVRGCLQNSLHKPYLS